MGNCFLHWRGEASNAVQDLVRRWQLVEPLYTTPSRAFKDVLTLGPGNFNQTVLAPLVEAAPLEHRSGMQPFAFIKDAFYDNSISLDTKPRNTAESSAAKTLKHPLYVKFDSTGTRSKVDSNVEFSNIICKSNCIPGELCHARSDRPQGCATIARALLIGNA